MTLYISSGSVRPAEGKIAKAIDSKRALVAGKKDVEVVDLGDVSNVQWLLHVTLSTSFTHVVLIDTCNFFNLPFNFFDPSLTGYNYPSLLTTIHPYAF